MIKIKYKGKMYNINKRKLKMVLSKLTSNHNEIEVMSLMKHFKLLDEHFLNNINKL